MYAPGALGSRPNAHSLQCAAQTFVGQNLGARKERRAIQALLEKIPRDITIVMIEHDVDAALAFAERITLLHYGSVIVEGSRAEVVADARTREIYLGA